MPRRILEGDVVSDKMDKTVTVLVERRFAHPVYKKYVKRTDKYAAHDEGNVFKVGDRVQIEECRPISRRKTWRVITATPEGRAPSVKKETAKPAEKKPVAKKEAAEKETAKKAAPKKSAPKDAKTVAAKKPAAKKAAPKKETAKKKDEKK